jgi:minor histocompatibility antigen H13
MADTFDPNIASDILTGEKEVEAILEAVKENVANETGKPVSTPEGIAFAYGSLVVMALIPIFLGSFRSVKHQNDQKAAGEPVESMSSKDAAIFPIYASCALFGLYIFFKLFSKDYINLLLTIYFFFLGVFALAHILSPIVSQLVPVGFPNANYQLLFFKRSDQAPVTAAHPSEVVARGNATAENQPPAQEELLNYEFDRRDILCLLVCIGIGFWYFVKKHWIANNLFGLAFAVNGVELLQLPRISTGCILLGGLFFYDIFWVFGTDVMVTVAKSFEAPIKLVFPQDILENGPFMANNFAMLGLGDIVIPGIFIALLLRFDLSQKKDGPKVYFYTGFLAYISGLLLTIFVMHVYKHAQPALLYLVPACVGAPLLMALVRGELMLLFKYDDSGSSESEVEVVDEVAENKEEKKDQ